MSFRVCSRRPSDAGPFSTFFFFFSSRRRHTRSLCDWSSDVCSSDLATAISGRAEVHCNGPAEALPKRAGESPHAKNLLLRGERYRGSRQRLRGSSPQYGVAWRYKSVVTTTVLWRATTSTSSPHQQGV